VEVGAEKLVGDGVTLSVMSKI